MTDDLEPESEELLGLQSPFHDVLNNFISALIQTGGVPESAIDHIAEHPPQLFDEYIEAALSDDEERRTKAAVAVLDVMFIGLLFAQYHDFFIEEGVPDEH